MNASTAIGTTATASPSRDTTADAHALVREDVSGKYIPGYVGRFAPSPTGQLHLGSLIAALGSYLDARHHGGRWQLRMEDLDTPRVVPGCADQILATLESFGLTWDGAVSWQSRHLDRFQDAAADLAARGFTFECACSRRLRLENEERGYPGTCRDKPPTLTRTATRFRIDDAQVTFEDRFQGRCDLPLRSMGDVVIRRRDGIFAYQLAVVVDDAHEGVTQVVRGADLLSSTAWQISLQRALNVICPVYAHLPLIVEPDGMKLAKSRRSIALNPARAAPLLLSALELLGQRPPSSLEFESVNSILKWGTDHWNPRVFFGTRSIAAPPPS